MNEFTKGPWRLSRYHHPYSEIVIGDGNDSRAKAEGRLICSNESNRRPTSEYRANAHLIAAAPDMYEALKEITKHAYKGIVMDVAYKALSKAEGKTK
jgi:hypothetical protein